MLNLLKIQNIALIESLSLEFGSGLNLLTGETGSGKSIIVDSLGALIGSRVSSGLIKDGAEKALVEGLFIVESDEKLTGIFEQSGIEIDKGKEFELIVKRELSATGRNRIFINNQMVTQGFLKKIGPFLADIHGQGEQATLFNPGNHLEILDAYASLGSEREKCAEKYREMAEVKAELDALNEDESQKLQLVDILRFQVGEIERSSLAEGEDSELEEEKKRLNNAEKIDTLGGEAYTFLYDSEDAVTAKLEKVSRRIDELVEYESKFSDYKDGLDSAKAILEDLAYALRDFNGSIEFSPERLEEIEARLAEISRLKRKYGGSIDAILDHLRDARKRLDAIEYSEAKEQKLLEKLVTIRASYVGVASDLHKKRLKSAKRFEKEVEQGLKSVALEKAKFLVSFKQPADGDITEDDKNFTAKGFDKAEFYFSANPGESPKPLAKVASGGEASRVMLVLTTTAKTGGNGKSAVFDEVDAGIGGRIAESVGLKLRKLSGGRQVLCVTHQPQVAALANQHFIVEKNVRGKQTKVAVRRLSNDERTSEIARMLAGENITETALKHAEELLRGTKIKSKGK